MIETFRCNKKKLEKNFPLKKVHAYSKKGQVWLDILNPTKEDVKFLEHELKFHHLAIEDVLNERQLAKVDHYDDYHFLVIHALGIADEGKHKHGVEVTQLNIFLSKNLIVTVHLKPMTAIEETKKRLKEAPELLQRGADYVAYMVLDQVVDDIFPVLGELEKQIETLEDNIFIKQTASGKRLLNQLFVVKKKLLHIRKVVWPQRETLSILASRNMKYIRPENLVYFRDVYDHVIRINSMLENYRELITGTMEGYLSVISNNLGTVMKKLTAISAIIMVPTLIASIYGTNFINVPEYQIEYGYYAALLAMLSSTVLLALYFKQKEWV